MVEIMPYQYLSNCDIYPCRNRAKYAIGHPNEPPSTYFIICEDCLRTVVEKAQALFEAPTNEKQAEQNTEEAPKEDLSQKTLFELRNLAKEKGIRGYTRLSREELISALEGVEI